MSGPAAVAARSTMRENPGADNSARVARQNEDCARLQGRGLYFEVQGVPDFELAFSAGRIAECTEGFPRKVWYREHR
jgi:hypothetical protein